MVTSSPSRPAQLTQRQVDDFARGHHEEAPRLFAGTAIASVAVAQTASDSSSPIMLNARDMAAIARSGAAPAGISRKISAASRTPLRSVRKKAKGRARKPSAQPKFKPPSAK